MVTIKVKNGVPNTNYFDFVGLSTDTKPIDFDDTSITNGSTFLEMDTSDRYIFDGENKIWYKLNT